MFSTGNHIWDKSEIIPYIANHNLLKPNNLLTNQQGKVLFCMKQKQIKKF